MKTFAVRRNFAGSTLVEMMMAAALTAAILGCIVAGANALRHGVSAADFHVTAQTEQLRIFDYVGRDLRNATSVTIINAGTRLDLVIPSDETGSLAMHLELPSVGTLHTTTAAGSQAISFYREGDRLIRECDGVQTELAGTVTDFSVSRSGALMKIEAIFSPKFARSQTGVGAEAMKISVKVFLRNSPAS